MSGWLTCRQMYAEALKSNFIHLGWSDITAENANFRNEIMKRQVMVTAFLSTRLKRYAPKCDRQNRQMANVFRRPVLDIVNFIYQVTFKMNSDDVDHRLDNIIR